VPAGTFNAYLVEGRGINTAPSGATMEVVMRTWWDPQRVRRPVIREEQRRVTTLVKPRDFLRAQRQQGRPEREAKTRFIATERHELVAFRQS
jgi:hypothetical protein